MDAKQAIALAKEWVRDIYTGERITNLGLEELKFDDHSNEWLVTLGFSRPWDVNLGLAMALSNDSVARRSFKIVRISDDGKVRSVEDRTFAGS